MILYILGFVFSGGIWWAEFIPPLGFYITERMVGEEHDLRTKD